MISFFSDTDYPIVYFYDFEKGKTIKLPPQYISNKITVISPRKDERYDFGNLNDIVFEWEENHFADFYSLEILKVGEGLPEVVISIHKIGNKIKYSEISDTELINKEMDFDCIVNASPYNTIYEQLKTGKYLVYINAYKIFWIKF